MSEPRSKDRIRDWIAEHSIWSLVGWYLVAVSSVSLVAAVIIWLGGSDTSVDSVHGPAGLFLYCFAAMHSHEVTPAPRLNTIGNVVMTGLALARLLIPAIFISLLVFRVMLPPGRIFHVRPRLFLARRAGRLTLEACSFSQTRLRIEDLRFNVFVRYEKRGEDFPIIKVALSDAGRDDLPLPFNLLPTRSANIRIEIIGDGDPRELANWETIPIICRRTPDGLEVVAIHGETRFERKSCHVVLRITGHMPQLDKRFSETTMLRLDDAIRDAWSPRWITSPMDPDDDRSVRNMNWGDYEDTDGWTTRTHVIDAFLRTAGPLPAEVSSGSGGVVEADTQRLSICAEFDRGDRPPPKAEVIDEGLCPHDRDLIRTHIRLYPGPDADSVTATMLRPRGLVQPAPAILCLHQTTQPSELGRREATGEGGNPQMHYALELAQRRFVTLAVDYPGFGDYGLDWRTAHEQLGYESVTMKALWNHVRAIDWLRAHEDVIDRRIGCIGHSLGGSNALFLAALDRRIVATACSAGFCSFANFDRGLFHEGHPVRLTDAEGVWGLEEHDPCKANLAGWSRTDKYMPWIAGRFNNRADRMLFDFDDIIGAIAPRALFISSPKRDDVFQFAGVERLLPVIKSHYARYSSRESALEITTPDYGHEWRDSERESGYRFLEKNLR